MSSFTTDTFSRFENLIVDTGALYIWGDLAGVNLSVTGVGTTITFQTTAQIASLSIADGTRATVPAGAMPLSKTLSCTGLSISGTGRLDLANNSLQLSYAADPISTIRAHLSSGFNSGGWNGPSIMTSAADPQHGLGFGDSADGVIAGLAANTILVRWSRYGDTNLDGSVNFSDVLALVQHYGGSGQSWDQGDFNYDSTVNFSDVLLLVQNYGQSLSSTAAPAALVASALLTENPIPRHRRTSR